jgi:O-antigen/teichoic acid export membrane protein
LKIKNSQINYILLQLTVAILGVILGKLIAVNFTPEEYGKFNIQFAIYTFVFGIFLSPFLQFIKSNTYTLLPKIGYKSLLNLALILIGLTYLFTALILYLKYENSLYLNLFLFIFIPINFIFNLTSDYVNVKNEIKVYTLANFFKSLITVLFLALFFKNSYNSMLIWSLQLIGFVSGIVVCLKFYNINYKSSFQISFLSVLKKYNKYSWPLIFMSFWTFLNNYFDRFALEYFFNSQTVGEYNAGYSVGSKFFLMLSPIFLTMLTPNIYNSDAPIIKKKKIVEYAKLYTYISIPIICFVYIFKDNLGFTFLSEKYLNGFTVIFITAVSYFFMTLTFLFETIFYSDSKTTVLLKSNIYSAIVNILLNILFIPLLGINGAALSSLIAFLIRFLLTYSFFTKYENSNFRFK